jgi:hypothetical protein
MSIDFIKIQVVPNSFYKHQKDVRVSMFCKHGLSCEIDTGGCAWCKAENGDPLAQKILGIYR